MKYISWNIDSINAALTGTSPRASLSRDVLETIAAEDADIIALQETKLPDSGMNKKQAAALNEYFPDHEIVWISSREPARKGYAGTMALYRKGLSVQADYPSIGAPEPMDMEGRLITLELDDCFFNLVYTPNAGDGLRRLKERQIWDRKYAEYLAGLDKKKPIIACGAWPVRFFPSPCFPSSIRDQAFAPWSTSGVRRTPPPIQPRSRRTCAWASCRHPRRCFICPPGRPVPHSPR